MKPHHTIVRSLVLILLLCLNGELCAQAVFHKQLFFDSSFYVTATASSPDGTIIVGGNARPYDVPDEIALLKIDATGTPVWGTQIRYTKGALMTRSIDVAADGRILVSGEWIDSTREPYSRPLLMRLESTGRVRWAYHYNIAGSETYIRAHCTTNDGGAVMVGSIGDRNASKGLLVKVDSIGRLEWQQIMTLGDQRTPSTSLFQVVEDADSSLIITGFTYINGSHFFQGCHLLRVSQDGAIIDTATYHQGISFLYPGALVVLPDRSFAVGIGALSIPQDGSLSAVMMFKDIHTVAWSKNYKVFNPEGLTALSMAADGTLIGAMNYDFSKPNDWHYIKLNSSGDLLAAAQTPDRDGYPGGLTPFRHSSGQLCVVMATTTDTSTTIELRTVSDSLTGCNTQQTLGTEDPFPITDTNFPLIFGPIQATFDPIKLTQSSFLPISSSFICSEAVDNVSPFTGHELSVSPNPVGKHSQVTITLPNDHTHGSIVLRDLTGKIVHHSNRMVVSSQNFQLSTDGLASGIYTIELLEADSFVSVWRGKVIVE